MQVGIYVKFLHIDFDGRDPLVSEIPLPSKTAKFPFQPMGYNMVIKRFNQLESAEKIHASRD